MSPRDPDFEAKVRASFAQQGAMTSIGAELVSVEPGSCVVRLPYSPEVSQQRGYFHGGVVATIADSAGGYAAFSLAPPATDVLTVEYKVNFMAPAHGVELVATGTVVKAGRTLSVCRVDVEIVTGGGARATCAVLQQTIMIVPAAKGETQPVRV